LDFFTASVYSSGASTGTYEAVELRDVGARNKEKGLLIAIIDVRWSFC
jgi:enolase